MGGMDGWTDASAGITESQATPQSVYEVGTVGNWMLSVHTYVRSRRDAMDA